MPALLCTRDAGRKETYSTNFRDTTLDAENNAVAIASASGYRCFTTVNSFKKYVLDEVLATQVT
jgi:hypothetical protein